MRIMAIDPGYEKMGVAVLEKISGNPPYAKGSRLAEASGGAQVGVAREVLLFSECFKTSSKSMHQERLRDLGKEIRRVIKKFKPQSLAIEKLFFTTNQKTALLVSEARGVIIYEAASAGLIVSEYTPLQAKVAVTGYGRSDKRQIAFMVEKLIAVDKKIKEDDEYDAIALGLTYFAREKHIK